MQNDTDCQLFTEVRDVEERALVDRLRALGLERFVSLPQLVVVGDTSSGKSSLLSALSGIAFPSSSGLTTRCATQLALTRCDHVHGTARLVRASRSVAGDGDQVCEVKRLEDVPQIIEKFTAVLVGEGQEISDDHIEIDVGGPLLPNLTLTDLPGLVRAVADGEDPAVIPRVRRMVQKYMSHDRAVILAIVPANVDVHNAEILQAAQTADPDGHRTIAVVTKLDLVDDGAEAAVLELLLNRKKSLALGYHAIKCRSEREVLDGVSIAVGLASEESFFRDHEYWRQLSANICGTRELAKRVGIIVQDNIRRVIPEILVEIEQQTQAAEAELTEMGNVVIDPSAQRREFFYWVMTYSRQLELSMEGGIDGLFTDPKLGFVRGKRSSHPRMRAVLRQKDGEFQQAIKQAIADMHSDEDSKAKQKVAIGDWVNIILDEERCMADCRVVECRGTDVKVHQFPEWLGASRWSYARRQSLVQLIRDNRGDELDIFPSYNVFTMCVRNAVRAWEQPSMALVDLYRQQAKDVSERTVASLNARDAIKKHLSSIAQRTLVALAKRAKENVRTQLSREDRPYTQDKQLRDELDKQRQVGQSLQQLTQMASGGISAADASRSIAATMHSNEERQVIDMDISLRLYLEVASRRFVDIIPMTLNDVILCAFVRDVQKELLSANDEEIGRLLQESPAQAERRRRLTEQHQCLVAAKEEIEAFAL